MVWTDNTRINYNRRHMRYSSDYTDDEWHIVSPFLERMHKVGRPRKHGDRSIWNAIQYIASTGCQWDQLPKDFAPFTTVQYHFYRLRDSGLLDVINEALAIYSCARLTDVRRNRQQASLTANLSKRRRVVGYVAMMPERK